ncbi:hypothetical protein Tco_0888003, partial [Tanacetum coccineum]
MDVDALLASKLQEEEREQFSIDEQARFLVETIIERKRFFTTQRAEHIKNKPPTRAQLRNKIVTYLKHLGKYTHNQLKIKSLEEIQKLYEREQKWIKDSIPMDSEVVGSSAEKGVGSRKKTLARKRTGEKDSEERRYDIRCTAYILYTVKIDTRQEVIVNGDAPAITSASVGTEGLIPPKTAEQKLARKNELKAKSTLLLAIPD